MKIKYTSEIDYFETNPSFQTPPSVLFQLLQSSAVIHSEKVGYRMDELIEQGLGWILNKLDMKVYRYPGYKERLDIFTWSRGIKGVKAKREFEIFSGKEKLLAASSIWVYVDSKQMKIKRIPDGMNDIYTTESHVALNEKLDRWKTKTDFSSDFEICISTRLSDYDPMEHINNTIYIEFLETALHRMIQERIRLSALRIQYYKEIDASVTDVTTGIKKTEDSYSFKIFNNTSIFAAGEMELSPVEG